MTVGDWGALAFGIVLGFLTHYLVRRDQKVGIGDLSIIVGVLLGTLVLDRIGGKEQISWYLIGLCIGFFKYWLAQLLGREQVKTHIKEGKPLPLFPFLRQGKREKAEDQEIKEKG